MTKIIFGFLKIWLFLLIKILFEYIKLNFYQKNFTEREIRTNNNKRTYYLVQLSNISQIMFSKFTTKMNNTYFFSST